MRDLLQVLRDEDSLHWKAVAHAWGVDLGAAGRDPLSHLVQAMLDPDRVPPVVTVDAMELVGSYGLRIQFSDGHGTGIFRFADLVDR